MGTLVSTGQITIVDNNDARPITAYITASNYTQQNYSKDESTVAFVPDWSVSPSILTAAVYVGGATGSSNVVAQLTNKKWSNDLSTSLGSGTTFNVNTNMVYETAPFKIYYFEGDYTDPITGLVTHVIAQIQFSVIKQGTNSVYLLPKGKTAIEESSTATKNVAYVCVELMRAAGVDTSGVTYQFYENNGTAQITTAMNTKYGMKSTAAGASPTGTASDIGVGLPAAAAWSANNTLVIHEVAVVDMATLRAVAKDADGNTYQCYFTVYDVSDPYDLQIISTAGEKFQNGVGTTSLYPIVYNGSGMLSVADTAAWSMKWYFYDGAAPGNRAGFIDTTRTAVTDGRNITANTAGASSIIGYDGAAITFAAGDMVKIVTPAGQARYYEVASGTTTANLTLRTATASTFLNAVWPAASIVLSEFVGGKLFVCAGTGSTAGTKTTTGSGSANGITLTGYEVDGKGTILCEATRP